jgi:hypothetical protein
MSLDNLGEFTNRGGEPPPSSPAGTAVAEPSAPVAEPPPVQNPTQDPARVQVTESKPDTFMADLVKSFEKATPPPQESTPPAEPVAAPEPSKTEPKVDTPEPAETDSYGLPKPPTNLTEKGQRNWTNFKTKAIEEIDKREKELKDLRSQLSARAKVDEEEVTKLRKDLADANKMLEQTAVERSPLFKEKILDQQESIRSRLSKIIEGTTLTPSDVERMIAGDMNSREDVLESHDLRTYRKSQIIDLLDKWDQVEADRTAMLANGRQSFEEQLRRKQTEDEARKAQFVRESEQHFENEMTTFAPQLEPYQRIEGNEKWNGIVDLLKTNARKIFSGNIDKQALAQTAILAPAAVVYQRFIVPELTKRIRDLEAQVGRMKGLAPTVTDRGPDTPTQPSLSSPNGDFVKTLVDRYRKEVGS